MPIIVFARGDARFRTENGVADVGVTEVDLADPLAAGIFRPTSGRLPRSAGEIVVNAALAARGPGVGATLELTDGSTYDVVGLAESTTLREGELAVGLPGSFSGTGDAGDRAFYGTGYLVGGGPVQLGRRARTQRDRRARHVAVGAHRPAAAL